MTNNSHKNRNKGFTLIELLVVITILGILSAIGLEYFISAQARGRDAKRKSDLGQISAALELYYSDYGKYPLSSGGQIEGCPSTGPTACVWANSSKFTDGKTVYIMTLPKDPSSGRSYYYQALSATSPQGFQLFAALENTQDINCLSGAGGTSSCTNPVGVPSVVTCGSDGKCNFAITSSNTSPTATPIP